MNAPQAPWIAAALLAAATAAQAFTDTNADMKELAADPAARVVVTGSARPTQALWVPPTAKALDSPRPVWPAPRAAAPVQALARQAPPAVLR